MSLQPAPKARSPKAAEQRFEEVLQYSLTCLSRAVWRAAATIRGPQGSMVLLTSEYPLRLRRQNGEDLYFSPALDFRYEEREDWHCKTLAYTYTLHTADAVELMSWQWRMGSSQLPHLHVRAEMENLGGAIRKLPLPTGRVAFEEIVEFLIRDLDVEPRMKDWKERVDEALRYFMKYRSWPGSASPPAE